jgi:hypothetical protein
MCDDALSLNPKPVNVEVEAQRSSTGGNGGGSRGCSGDGGGSGGTGHSSLHPAQNRLRRTTGASPPLSASACARAYGVSPCPERSNSVRPPAGGRPVCISAASPTDLGVLLPRPWRWGARQRGAPHPGSRGAAHLLVLVTLLTAYALPLSASDRVHDRDAPHYQPPTNLQEDPPTTRKDSRDATVAEHPPDDASKRALRRLAAFHNRHTPTRATAPPPPPLPHRLLGPRPALSSHSPYHHSALFEHQAEITDSWTPTEHSPGLTITTTGPWAHPPGKAEPARRQPRRSLPSPSPRHVVPRSVPPLTPDYYPIFHSSEEDLLQQEHPPAVGPRDLAPADHPPVKAPVRAPRRSAASHTRHTPTRSAAPPPPAPPRSSAHG